MREHGFGGKRSVFVFLAIFLVGWLAHTVYSSLGSNYAEPKQFDVYELENSNAVGEKAVSAKADPGGAISAKADSTKVENSDVTNSRIENSDNTKIEYNAEKSSPSDHIKESQIHVLEDKIILDIKDASWAKFTDTNSMDPVIDAGSNSIELKPKSSEDVKVGDIISYHSEYADGLIIHRVVEVGEDSTGWYVRVKGDNLEQKDPGKIRFSQIEGVVVGVIY